MTIEIKYTASFHNEFCNSFMYMITATRFDLKEHLQGDHQIKWRVEEKRVLLYQYYRISILPDNMRQSPYSKQKKCLKRRYLNKLVRFKYVLKCY